jgi:hypothetical protein
VMAKFISDQVIGGGGGISTTVTPSAVAVGPGVQIWDSTIGTGTFLTSDGITFNSLNPTRLIAQSGIPLILPSSGTLSAVGALSGITALAATYPNCWMFFPANAIATTSAAGMYFVQMSSTTAGTVFQNTFTSGSPTIPAASALIPCTTASNYTTLTATNESVVTIPIPANSMGANGRIALRFGATNNNSAGAKQANVLWAGASLGGTSNTTNLFSPMGKYVINRGVTNSQFSDSGGGYAAAAGAPVLSSQDTTAAVNLALALNLATATDTCQIDYFYIEVTPQ